MADHQETSSLWTRSEVRDILRRHVSAFLDENCWDSAMSRLVCRAWCDSFPLRLVQVSPAKIQEDADGFRKIARMAYSILFRDPAPESLEWLGQGAIQNQFLGKVFFNFSTFSLSDAEAICRILHLKIPNLHTLSFWFRSASLDSFKLIADAIGTTKIRLRSLDFSNCQIGDDCAAALFTALRLNTTIETLDLSNCDLSDAGHIPLMDFIKANRNVTNLSLAMNRDLPTMGRSFVENLRDALAIDKTLTKLNLCFMKCETIHVLFPALQHNKTVRKLNLLLNKLPKDLSPSVYDPIAQNQGLQRLVLSIEAILPDTAAAIGRILQSNKTLRTLHIFPAMSNHVHDFAPMMPGLAQNSTLRNICLSSVAPQYVEQLANAVDRSRGSQVVLEKISICCSTTGVFGTQLLQALTHLPTLESLELVRVLQPDALLGLVPLIERSTSLTNLQIDQSEISAEALIPIVDSIKNRNKTLRWLLLSTIESGERVWPILCDLIASSPCLEHFEGYGSSIPRSKRPIFEAAVLQSSTIRFCELSFFSRNTPDDIELVAELRQRS
jgi:hypothetical protein